MRRCAWLLLALGAAVHADPAAVTVDPGDAPGLACPADTVRSVRQPGRGPELRPAAAAGIGRAALRIGLWGDSHTAAAGFADAMLAAMGLDPDATLPTFLSASWGLKGVAQPLRATCASNSWRTELGYQGARPVGAGLLAISADRHGSMLGLDFRWPHAGARLASARLHLSKQVPARTLVLGLSADGGPEALLALDGPVDEPVEIRLRRPAATLQVRLVAGEVTVHGLSPAYAEPPRHHLDVFSIPGATVEGWRHADVRHPAFAGSKPVLDFALLQYGTNDAPNAAQRPDDYGRVLRESLRQFRLAYPGARCVLVGPPDRGGRGRQGDASSAHFLVARVQQQLAAEFACDFWDWQAAMGGRGSAQAGAVRTPATVQPDRTHLTAAGYRESGEAFGRWLSRRRP